MAKAIEQLLSGMIVGHAALGSRGAGIGTVAQQVHDGDTISVQAVGNFGVRFLGVDAPEISFTLPKGKKFVELGNPAWEKFLTDPFAGEYPPFDPPLTPGLRKEIKSRVGQGTAQNHYRLAQSAQKALEKEIQGDLAALGQSAKEFQFFLAFASEVMDRYGRLLCYVNRCEPATAPAESRPLTYNERLLCAGWTAPCFIWPNINPFRRQDSMLKAVFPPGKANAIAEKEKSLRQARKWVRDAREQGIGIFDKQDPLRLQAFEVRYLARRRPPDRWVVDLGESDDVLIQPQKYYTVANWEDRLFIPEEFVPWFVKAGWKRQK